MLHHRRTIILRNDDDVYFLLSKYLVKMPNMTDDIYLEVQICEMYH